MSDNKTVPSAEEYANEYFGKSNPHFYSMRRMLKEYSRLHLEAMRDSLRDLVNRTPDYKIDGEYINKAANNYISKIK